MSLLNNEFQAYNLNDYSITLNGFRGERQYKIFNPIINCSVETIPDNFYTTSVIYTSNIITPLSSSWMVFEEYADFSNENRNYNDIHFVDPLKRDHWIYREDKSINGNAFRKKTGNSRYYWLNNKEETNLIIRPVIRLLRWIKSDEFKASIKSVGTGNTMCKYNAHSKYIQCAINPTGNCNACKDYESVSKLVQY